MLYTVIDYYEGREILGYNITQRAYAEDLRDRRIEDTDGECAVSIFAQRREFDCANHCFDDDAFDLSVVI